MSELSTPPKSKEERGTRSQSSFDVLPGGVLAIGDIIPDPIFEKMALEDFHSLNQLRDDDVRAQNRSKMTKIQRAFLDTCKLYELDEKVSLDKIYKYLFTVAKKVEATFVPATPVPDAKVSMDDIDDYRLEAMMVIVLASQYEMNARPGAILLGWPSTSKSFTIKKLALSPMVAEEDVFTKNAWAPGTVEGKENRGIPENDFKKCIIVADAATAIMGDPNVINKQLGQITKAIDDDHMWISDGNGVRRKMNVQSTLMIGITNPLYYKMIKDLTVLGNRLMIIPFRTDRAFTPIESRTRSQMNDTQHAVFSILENTVKKHPEMVPCTDEMIAEATDFGIKVTTLRSLYFNSSKQGGEGQSRVTNQLLHAACLRAMLWDREPTVADVVFFEQFYHETIYKRDALRNLVDDWGSNNEDAKVMHRHAQALGMATSDGFKPEWTSFIIKTCYSIEDDFSQDEISEFVEGDEQ